MNQNNVDFESQVLVEFYKRLFRCLEVKITDMFYFPDIMGKVPFWESRNTLNRLTVWERIYIIHKKKIDL